MFSVPSPPEMEVYDLPLVHLHDSSTEMKAFLQALYGYFLTCRPDGIVGDFLIFCL